MNYKNSISFFLLMGLVSCQGGGNGEAPVVSCGGESSSRLTCLSAPISDITATQFVGTINGKRFAVTEDLGESCNAYECTSRSRNTPASYTVQYDAYGERIDSRLVRGPGETARTQVAGQDAWFVIYDSVDLKYKAVSLNYLRSISTEFFEGGENRFGRFYRLSQVEETVRNSPQNGDSYEEVSYDAVTDMFRGSLSGFAYEDQAETKDVSLMAAEQEEIGFYQKAANLSVAYSLGIEASTTLVALAEHTETLLKRNNGSITNEDKQAFTNVITSVAGITPADVLKAAASEQSKDALIRRIAQRIGTSATNLENRILPELFSISL